MSNAHPKRAPAVLFGLLASAAVSCKLPTATPEILPDAGRASAAAEPASMPAPPVVPSDAMSGEDAGAPMSTAPAVPRRPQPSAAMSTPNTDAGSAPDAQPLDEISCSFELSACLTADPLGYAECWRKSAAHCPVFAAASNPLLSGDGGSPPSEACVMQQAECLMRSPERVSECNAQLQTCTL
jgi:hypothetical protein